MSTRNSFNVHIQVHFFPLAPSADGASCTCDMACAVLVRATVELPDHVPDQSPRGQPNRINVRFFALLSVRPHQLAHCYRLSSQIQRLRTLTNFSKQGRVQSAEPRKSPRAMLIATANSPARCGADRTSQGCRHTALQLCRCTVVVLWP